MRNIIMLFAKRVAPIFITFGWIIPQFKIRIDASGTSSLRKDKPQTKSYLRQNVSDKAKPRLYSRRLTRNQENYSKD